MEDNNKYELNNIKCNKNIHNCSYNNEKKCKNKNEKKGYIGRLAPTPSGYMHVGHARTFWIAQERAQAAGGVLILRIEDLDIHRCKPYHLTSILEDLVWFGIKWDRGPTPPPVPVAPIGPNCGEEVIFPPVPVTTMCIQKSVSTTALSSSAMSLSSLSPSLSSSSSLLSPSSSSLLSSLPSLLPLLPSSLSPPLSSLSSFSSPSSSPSPSLSSSLSSLSPSSPSSLLPPSSSLSSPSSSPSSLLSSSSSLPSSSPPSSSPSSSPLLSPSLSSSPPSLVPDEHNFFHGVNLDEYVDECKQSNRMALYKVFIHFFMGGLFWLFIVGLFCCICIFYYLYVDSLTYAFGWSVFLCRMSFCDTPRFNLFK
jgi:hypothetical protein